LARTVTHSTVEECKQRMSHQEFKRWLALYKLEPWGDEWGQTRAVAASNLAPWSKKRIRLERFFPKPRARPAADMERALTPWVKAHNRRFKNGRHRRPRNDSQRQQQRTDDRAGERE